MKIKKYRCITLISHITYSRKKLRVMPDIMTQIKNFKKKNSFLDKLKKKIKITSITIVVVLKHQINIILY